MDWSIILCFVFVNVIQIQSSSLEDDLREDVSIKDCPTSRNDHNIDSTISNNLNCEVKTASSVLWHKTQMEHSSGCIIELAALMIYSVVNISTWGLSRIRWEQSLNMYKRRYSLRDFSNRNKDYIIISAPKDMSREGSLPVIRPSKKFKYYNKFRFGRKKRPRPHNSERNLLSAHSPEVRERVLPPSEAAKPGHTLIQPTKTMLKSAAKYPRTDGQSLVYGNLDNLGIVHGKTPDRVTYSDFRKANLFEMLAKLIQSKASTMESLRRSPIKANKPRRRKPVQKLLHKTKTPMKQEQKKTKKFKKLDSKRTKMKKINEYSSEVQSGKQHKPRRGTKINIRQLTFRDSDESKHVGTRGFSKFKKKPKPQYQPKKIKRNPIIDTNYAHGKIVDSLKQKLEEKLKSSKMKKKVPISNYKRKRHTPKNKLNKPQLVRIKGIDKARLTDSNSREGSREYKSKTHKKPKYYKYRMKKKRIFRQNNNAEDDSYEDYKSDEKPKEKKKDKNKKPREKDKENKARLVYGSPDNYGILWGKKPYRTLYSDFRRTSSLLGKILEAYHSYKREKKLKKALIAIRVWPLEKTKVNRDNSDSVKNRILLNDGNEILDDMSIEINDVGRQFRKQRKPKVKSAWRNRDDQYDKGNKTECKDSDEASSTNESDYEQNAGNPYTLFKNKYKQNWPWHFELGDHINLNPFGPEFKNQGPSGADFFFNRKWWYFNQDDYIPFR